MKDRIRIEIVEGLSTPCRLALVVNSTRFGPKSSYGYHTMQVLRVNPAELIAAIKEAAKK